MKTNHNLYVSTPNWFSSIKEEVKQTKPVIQLTVYYGSGSNSNNNGISSLSICNKAVYKEDTLQLSDLSIIGYAVIAILKKEEDNAGELTVNDVWSSSLFIPVVGGSEITINTSYDSTFTYGIAFYDILKKYISGNHTVQELIQTVTVPANAVYFRICSLSVYEEFNVKYQGLSNYSYKQLTDIYGKGLDPFTSIDDSFEYLYSSTFTSDKISFVADYPLKLEIDSDNNIHFNINDLLLSGVFVTTSEEEQDIEGIKIFKNGLGIGDFLLVPDKTNNSIKLIHKNELIEKESNTYFGNMYVTGWFSALGMSPGGIGPSFGGSNNLFELNDVSAVYNELGIPYAVLGTTGENTVGKVLTWDGSKWYADESLNSAKGDERYLLKKIFSKIFTAYNEKGEIIDITDYDSVIDNVSINYSLWSTGFISAYGISKGDSNPTALYQLADVLSENNEVQGAVIGSVLTYNGTHWYASKLDIDSNIDTNDILNILEQYNYLTKDKAEELFLTKNQADDAYLLKQVFKNIFTAYDANDNEVDICDISANINNIKINYGFWSNGFISALGKQLTEPSSATALYQLVDVLANETNTGVKYAKKGSVLTFDGTHWVAGVINTDDGMIDEAAVMEIIERYNYLDQTEGDKRYLLNNLFLKIFTAYDKQGNEVALSSNTIDNIKVNYNFWSYGYLSSRGISDDIIDAIDFIEVDEKTISKRNGYLEVIGGVGNSGVTDYNDLDNLPDLTIYALKDSLDGYLPLAGGTITDNLRLRKGSEYTSPYLYFGDSDEVWLKEVTDTHLTIHADGSVKIDSPKTVIDGIEIKKSASGVLFIDANLVVSGGITMYGTDGTTANTIWDNAPIANTNGKKGVASYDPNFFSVNNGVVTFIGEVGGSGVTDYNDLTNKPDLSVYALKTSLSSYQAKITSTNKLAYSLISETPTIPTNTNQLTNGAGFITSSGTANKANSLTTARTISLTGQATGSTTFDGSTNKSITVTIPTRSVQFNGTKYTVLTNSDTTSDMPDIYAANYAGTANQVCVSGGNGKAPSWVNQSAITSGACSGNAATATKVTVTGTTTDGVFRVVLANSTDGNSQPNSLYMDNVTGAGYNPYSNTFVASAFNGNGLTYSDGTKANLSSKGWYRIATSTAATNAGGTYIFSIKRSYNNTNNEAYIVAVVFDQSGCHFTQLAGHYGTQLITQIRCTYNFDGTAHFDIYYNGTETNAVYVNGIGNMTVQTPTSTSSTLTNTDSFTLTNGAKSYTKEAYAITLCRKHSNGGTYIRYCAKDQLVKTWAVGPDSNHDFSWYWTDTSANIDSHRMRLDSYGNLTVEGNLLVKGGITMYADSSENPVETFYTKDIFIQGYGDGRYSRLSNGGSYLFYAPTSGSWATGWSVYNASGTKLASACGAFGNGGVLDYLYYGGEYNTPWLKLKKTTLEGKYWLLNDTDTNPYLKFVHPYSSSTYTWYIQGYQGYLYLGSSSTKSLRVSSDGSIYTPKTLTQGSDIRYKDVHKDLVLSLKEMSDAPSLEFHFMDDESKLTHIGTSAQYWQFVDGVVSEDNEGRLGMDYSSLGVVMGISLAKELSNYESMTDKEIRELKKRIGELEEEIETLKKV